MINLSLPGNDYQITIKDLRHFISLAFLLFQSTALADTEKNILRNMSDHRGNNLGTFSKTLTHLILTYKFGKQLLPKIILYFSLLSK